METGKDNILASFFHYKRKMVWINSSLCYLCSFLFLFIPTQYLTSYVATKYFNIPTKFHHAKIIFNIPDSSPLWTQISIIIVYLITPIICLIFGISIIFYFYKKRNSHRNLKKLFFMWGYLHAANMFWGGLLVGLSLPSIKGFGFVPAWMYFSHSAMNGFWVVAFIGLFLNGTLLNIQFAGFGYNESILTEKIPQILFKIVLLFLPFLTINGLFLIAGLPDNTPYERLLLLSMFIQIIPMFSFKYVPIPPKEKNRLVQKISIGYIVTFIILVSIMIVWYVIKNNIF